MPSAEWYLSSLEAFDDPITFHQRAHEFHTHHAVEIRRKAQPLLDEMRRCHPDKAGEFEQSVNALAARFERVAQTHIEAVTHLRERQTWHAGVEKAIADALPPASTLPSTPPAEAE